MNLWIQEIIEIVVWTWRNIACAYKIFNILDLEFEYYLKSTLDKIKYMLSNVN